MVGLVNGLTMVVALYDMLGGFPTGQHCSELAHNFIMAGGSFNLLNPKICSGELGKETCGSLV